MVEVEDLSPVCRRLTLGEEGLRDVGIPHHPRDRRFTLILPHPRGDRSVDLPAHVDRHLRPVTFTGYGTLGRSERE